MAEKLSGAPGLRESNDFEPMIRKIVGDILEIDPYSINPDARLVEDLGMDSMMALEILAKLEKKYRIRIPEKELPKITSLRQVLQLTNKYVS